MTHYERDLAYTQEALRQSRGACDELNRDMDILIAKHNRALTDNADMANRLMRVGMNEKAILISIVCAFVIGGLCGAFVVACGH